VNVGPPTTATFLLTKVLNPIFSILTTYVPGMRSITKYVPADVVEVVCDTLVSTLVTVTFASGTTAPAWSVTSPLILLTACACKLIGRDSDRPNSMTHASQ